MTGDADKPSPPPVVTIATPDGFIANDWQGRRRLLASDITGAAGEAVATGGADIITPEVLAKAVVECVPETRPEDLAEWLPHITAIEIRFPSSFDGRGFSIGRRLRQLGYRGAMRAVGRLHIDQFRHALLCGIDGVGLTEAHAARQPESHWVKAATTASPQASYQARLGVRE